MWKFQESHSFARYEWWVYYKRCVKFTHEHASRLFQLANQNKPFSPQIRQYCTRNREWIAVRALFIRLDLVLARKRGISFVAKIKFHFNGLQSNFSHTQTNNTRTTMTNSIFFSYPVLTRFRNISKWVHYKSFVIRFWWVWFFCVLGMLPYSCHHSRKLGM